MTISQLNGRAGAELSQTDIERSLLGAVERVLGISAVEPTISFAFIGDSLSALMCVIEIRATFAIDIDTSLLLDEQLTLRDVAKCIWDTRHPG